MYGGYKGISASIALLAMTISTHTPTRMVIGHIHTCYGVGNLVLRMVTANKTVVD